MNVYFLGILGLVICLSACRPAAQAVEEQPQTNNLEQNLDLSSSIIRRSIERHGGQIIQNSIIQFDFRGRQYRATRQGGKFIYERLFKDEANRNVRDVLSNTGLVRSIDGREVSLTAKDSSAYSNSVNSVIYFALLPYFLEDPSVNTTYLGESSIHSKPYHKLKVTFNEKGGGKDFQDEFIYWIHRDSSTLDYLAYNYLTDGGGARFRSAHHIQEKNGIRFTNFINYKPEIETMDVASFDRLFEQEKMKELSRIELENIKVTPIN